MLYFDDIEVGYRSEVGRYDLERDEMVEFARRWDPQPIHIDEDGAAQSMFGGLVASSLHLFAICTRLFFDHADNIQVMARPLRIEFAGAIYHLMSRGNINLQRTVEKLKRSLR